MAFRIVKTGTWLYGGSVEESVDIVALNYDWWYSLAEADENLEPGDEPMPLGPDGCIYYARFQYAMEPSEPTWVDSPGHADLEAAMRYAEAKVSGGVRWHAETAA